VLRFFPVRVLVTYRFLIIAAGGWAVLALSRSRAAIDARAARRILLIGVIGGGIYQYLFVLGLSETTSFSSALLNTTAPLIALAILAALRLERIHARHWGGYGLAMVGIAIYLLQNARAGGRNVRGDLVSLAAAACWAVYSILVRGVSERYPAVTVGAWTYSVCFASIALYGAAPTARFPIRRVPAEAWALLFLSGTCAVTIGWIVWARGIRILGVAGTVKYSFLVPILAGVFAAAFQGERFTVVKIAGASAVLGGIALARVSGWRTPPLAASPDEPNQLRR
jgi:drug/metabolite transporter (DMT)-like permease